MLNKIKSESVNTLEEFHLNLNEAVLVALKYLEANSDKNDFLDEDIIHFRDVARKINSLGFNAKIYKIKDLNYHSNNNFVVVCKNGNYYYPITLKNSHFQIVNSNTEIDSSFFSEIKHGLLIEKKTIKNDLFGILKSHQKNFWLLFIVLLITSIIQLVVPFLTRLIVDQGINKNDLDLIELIIYGLIFLKISSIILQLLKNWLSFLIGNKISIAFLHTFIIKLTKISISYFLKNSTGSVLQRMNDYKRIQAFISSIAINLIFNFLLIFVFIFVIFTYDKNILLVFFGGNILYFLWGLSFLKIMWRLDLNLFKYRSNNQDVVIQFATSVIDQRLFNYSEKIIDFWENSFLTMFNAERKFYFVNQLQSNGALIISELSSVLITYFAAKGVILGELTFGQMLSLQYIVGQIDAPLKSILGQIMSGQSAYISYKRLNDVFKYPNDDFTERNINEISSEGEIKFNQVYFRYPESKQNVLDKLILRIPRKKTTAIIGPSGCGKSTVFKLLMKFYNINKGEILVDETPLNLIDATSWRNYCGVIFQDSLIFEDTIKNNIIMDMPYDRNKLLEAAINSNSFEFIQKQPYGFNTKVSFKGEEWSKGQIQRILLARIFYKLPEIVLLDEATSAIDKVSENQIFANLKRVFKNKTIIFITHRINLVQNADLILMMNNGRVIGYGSHHELINKNEQYKELVVGSE